MMTVGLEPRIMMSLTLKRGLKEKRVLSFQVLLGSQGARMQGSDLRTVSQKQTCRVPESQRMNKQDCCYQEPHRFQRVIGI